MTAFKSICRLCLRRDNCVLMDNMSREVLEILEVKVNLNISKEPAMCRKCRDIVKKLLFFKSDCIDSEEMILLYNAVEKQTHVDLKTVFKHNNPGTPLLYEDYNICRLCLTPINEENCTSIDILIDDAEDMSKCMSDTDLNISKNPIVCTHCKNNLNCYLKFVQNCIDTEVKINIYLKNHRTENDKPVKLDDVLQYLFKSRLFNAYVQICIVKQEEIKIEERANQIVTIKEVDIKKEEISITENGFDEYHAVCEKTEDTLPQIGGREYIKSEYLTCENDEKLKIYDYRNTKDTTLLKTNKTKSISEVYNQKIEKEEPKKGSNISHNQSVTSKKSGNSYRKKIKPKDPGKPVSISYENNKLHGCRKKVITYLHSRNGIVYECKNCDFKTRHLSSIRDHNISQHKTMSEVQTYKCAVCNYESRFKKTLKKHIIRHQNRRSKRNDKFKGSKENIDKPFNKNYRRYVGYRMEIKRYRDRTQHISYECTNCAYKTQYKHNIWNHQMSQHRAIVELNSYKCAICNYQTVWKRILRLHILAHLKERQKSAESKRHTDAIRHKKELEYGTGDVMPPKKRETESMPLLRNQVVEDVKFKKEING